MYSFLKSDNWYWQYVDEKILDYLFFKEPEYISTSKHKAYNYTVKT